jgi:hypothetical protein
MSKAALGWGSGKWLWFGQIREHGSDAFILAAASGSDSMRFLTRWFR